jgi:16S rRNA (guanine527-N7)-methyltransferase
VHGSPPDPRAGVPGGRHPLAAAAVAPSLRIEGLIADAARLGLSLTPGQAQLLLQHLVLLRRWNAVHNLTAIGGEDAALTHHLLDSLAIVPEIRRRTGDRPIRVLDVGSGGGLPGIPLAVAHPAAHVTVIDKVQKKVAFLTQAKVELRLANLQAVHARVEAWRAPHAFDVIVARALATLGPFVRWTRHLRAPHGFWAAMKAATWRTELTGLPSGIRVAEAIALEVPGLGERRELVLLEAFDELSAT